MPTEPDAVDRLVESWEAAQPGEDYSTMAIVARLVSVTAAARRAIDANFAAVGISTADFDVLSALRRGDLRTGIMASALAAAVVLSPAGMTARIDRLEAAGLVERVRDREDRRAVHVCLTAAGREVVDRAVTSHLATEAAFLAPLSAADRAVLDRLLRRLAAGR